MHIKHFGTLFLLAALLFLAALNSYQLRGSTEPRVAGIAVEVLIDNDWITPKLNGTPFLEKPPLSIWLDAFFIKTFGTQPLAVRLASALAGIATALIVFWQLVRLQKNVNGAWLAGLLLITMFQFWSNARQVGEDALLTLGIALALFSFLRAQQQSALKHWLLYAIGLSIATLSKGVLGLAIPGAVIFAYLLSSTIIDKRFAISDWLRPAMAALIGLLPLCIWLYFLYRHNGAQAVTELLWSNSVGRFGGDFENNGHFEPFYYYLSKLPEVFLPWNILVFLGLWRYLKSARSDRIALFFACWLLAPFVLLSLSSGKRMVYLLALYPAAAVIAADYWQHLIGLSEARASTSKFAAWLYRRHKVLLASIVSLLCVAFLYRAAIWEPKQDRKESMLPLAEQMTALTENGYHIALYNPIERLAGATVFYTASTWPELHDKAALAAFLAADSHNIAIVQNDTETPSGDLRVLQHIRVDKRHYYFVAH